MDNCGLICVLFIWLGFLWPIIVSSLYLIIKKKQITAKGKYFLFSSFAGYALMIGFNFLIAFLAKSFLEPHDLEMKTLALVTTIILFIPPVIAGYILSKKYSFTQGIETS